MTKVKEIYETTCTVDSEWGTISPRFNLDEDNQYSSTSGELKYFQKLKGKKLKITIEVLENVDNDKPSEKLEKIYNIIHYAKAMDFQKIKEIEKVLEETL